MKCRESEHLIESQIYRLRAAEVVFERVIAITDHQTNETRGSCITRLPRQTRMFSARIEERIGGGSKGGSRRFRCCGKRGASVGHGPKYTPLGTFSTLGLPVLYPMVSPRVVCCRVCDVSLSSVSNTCLSVWCEGFGAPYALTITPYFNFNRIENCEEMNAPGKLHLDATHLDGIQKHVSRPQRLFATTSGHHHFRPHKDTSNLCDHIRRYPQYPLPGPSSGLVAGDSCLEGSG